MAKAIRYQIRMTPNPRYGGLHKYSGLFFVDGKAETADPDQINYARAQGWEMTRISSGEESPTSDLNTELPKDTKTAMEKNGVSSSNPPAETPAEKASIPVKKTVPVKKTISEKKTIPAKRGRKPKA